jgi:hypothetical protein
MTIPQPFQLLIPHGGEPLLGWTDFHWNRYVLIGRNRRGVEFSMGEMVCAIGRHLKRFPEDQRLARVEILGPSGNVIAIAGPETVGDAHREVAVIIRHLGGSMRGDASAIVSR